MSQSFVYFLDVIGYCYTRANNYDFDSFLFLLDDLLRSITSGNIELDVKMSRK